MREWFNHSGRALSGFLKSKNCGAWDVFSVRTYWYIINSFLSSISTSSCLRKGWSTPPTCMPGVGFMVRVTGLGSESPEFKSRSAVELIPGGVDSACHPSEVSKMSGSLLVYCVGVAIRPGLCPITKETASAAPTLRTECGPNGWNGWITLCDNQKVTLIATYFFNQYLKLWLTKVLYGPKD